MALELITKIGNEQCGFLVAKCGNRYDVYSTTDLSKCNSYNSVGCARKVEDAIKMMNNHFEKTSGKQKNYHVQLYYHCCLDVEISAIDELDAVNKAQQWADSLDADDFLNLSEPQSDGHDVELLDEE